MEDVDRTLEDDYERVPPEPSRRAIAKNHRGTDGEFLLRRRSAIASRLRRSKIEIVSGPEFIGVVSAHAEILPVIGCSTGKRGENSKSNFACANRSAASASPGVSARAKINPRKLEPSGHAAT